MLKSHKQNLVPESEFHIREERVKAQKTDGDTNSKQAPTPPLLAPEKKEEKREREERARGKSPLEEKPQKVAKVKGPVTAAEAKAAEAKALAAAEEKEQEKRESKESSSEAVEAVSPPNPEPLAAAQPESKVKVKTEKTRMVENGNNHVKKTEVKTEDEKSPDGGKAVAEGVKKVQEGEDREKRSSSKERPGSVKAEDVTPKNKPSSRASMEKSDVGAPKVTTTAAASPVTRGNKLGQNSPTVSQNGPTGASPSPARAGQRRQLSETEATEVVPDKGEIPGKREFQYTNFTLCFVFLYIDQKRRKVDEKVMDCVCVCVCVMTFSLPQMKQEDPSTKDKEADKRKRVCSIHTQYFFFLSAPFMSPLLCLTSCRSDRPIKRRPRRKDGRIPLVTTLQRPHHPSLILRCNCSFALHTPFFMEQTYTSFIHSFIHSCFHSPNRGGW